MNLILNARDAMPTAGGSRFRRGWSIPRWWSISATPAIGIAPENIARIYDPFFTTKDVGQGTGSAWPSPTELSRSTAGAYSLRAVPAKAHTSPSSYPPLSLARCRRQATRSRLQSDR